MQKKSSTINLLILDDSPMERKILSDALKDTYNIYCAADGREGLERVLAEPIDLILSDIVMPELDGIQFYKKLLEHEQTRHIPVIFITSIADIGAKVQLMELGAFDYILKPYNVAEVKARLFSHTQRLRRQQELELSRNALSQSFEFQTHEIGSFYDRFYDTIVQIALAKSKETKAHLTRTKYYIAQMLKPYLQTNRAGLHLNATDLPTIIDQMMQAATTHDIGKVGIPDSILLKPGKLTSAEYAIIKTHPQIGYNLLTAKEEPPRNDRVLIYAKEIVRHHHERWDGKGYPDQLFKTDIPPSARLMAIADVYDALVSKRVYKAAVSHEKAVRIIAKESGKAFDPTLVDIFLNEHQQIAAIAQEYRDTEITDA